MMVVDIKIAHYGYTVISSVTILSLIVMENSYQYKYVQEDMCKESRTVFAWCLPVKVQVRLHVTVPVLYRYEYYCSWLNMLFSVKMNDSCSTGTRTVPSYRINIPVLYYGRGIGMHGINT
jgi:hypothetical protein